LGIPTGGTAAKGFLTEDGPDPSLKEFGLVEHDEPGYPPRTRQNIADADGTVIFGDPHSAGSAGTIQVCKAMKKPYKVNPAPQPLATFLLEHRIHILNVAGNRRSKLTSGQMKTYREILRTGLLIFLQRFY
jgi:hypothetical protein